MPNERQDKEQRTADLSSLPLEEIAASAEQDIVVTSSKGRVEYRDGGRFASGEGSGFILANDQIESVDARTILRSAESVSIKSDSMECAVSMPADHFLTVADLLAPALEYARTILNHEVAEIFYFDDRCQVSGDLSHLEEEHAPTNPIPVQLETAAGERAAVISFCTLIPQCRLHHLRPE